MARAGRGHPDHEPGRGDDAVMRAQNSGAQPTQPAMRAGRRQAPREGRRGALCAVGSQRDPRMPAPEPANPKPRQSRFHMPRSLPRPIGVRAWSTAWACANLLRQDQCAATVSGRRRLWTPLVRLHTNRAPTRRIRAFGRCRGAVARLTPGRTAFMSSRLRLCARDGRQSTDITSCTSASLSMMSMCCGHSGRQVSHSVHMSARALRSASWPEYSLAAMDALWNIW